MLVAPAPVADAPRRFTVEEYDRIPDDVFGERVELIEGLIYTKMGQGFGHITAIRLVIEALNLAFSEGFNVSGQLPIGLGDESKPEPDVMVLRGAARDYDGRYPDPRTEVALLVEVSDSSLARDTDLKARLYATHGIPEYWIVNLQSRALEVRRRPLPDGLYAETILVLESESVAVGKSTVAIASLLPKASLPPA